MHYLLLREEELEVVDLLSQIRHLVHVPVEAGALLELTAHLVVGEVSVAALGHVDLVSHALVVAILALKVV